MRYPIFLFASLFLALLPTLVLAQNPLGRPPAWEGTFSDGSVTVTLQRSQGAIAGQLETGGDTYPIRAHLSADHIEGTFGEFEFDARLVDAVLILNTGGSTYHLPSAQQSNPLARTVPSDPRQQREEAVIASLRQLSTAQNTFREGDREGDGEFDYAASLRELAQAGLIDADLAQGRRDRYIFEVVRSTTVPEFVWAARAYPESGEAGDKCFAITQQGTIVYSRSPLYLVPDHGNLEGRFILWPPGTPLGEEPGTPRLDTSPFRVSQRYTYALTNNMGITYRITRLSPDRIAYESTVSMNGQRMAGAEPQQLTFDAAPMEPEGDVDWTNQTFQVHRADVVRVGDHSFTCIVLRSQIDGDTVDVWLALGEDGSPTFPGAIQTRSRSQGWTMRLTEVR